MTRAPLPARRLVNGARLGTAGVHKRAQFAKPSAAVRDSVPRRYTSAHRSDRRPA